MSEVRNSLIHSIALRPVQILNPSFVTRPGKRTAIATFSFCLLLATVAAGQVPADSLLQSLRPSADVNDHAGILTPEQKEMLEARCKALRQKNGTQFAVVTIKSLEGGQIDDFANKLFVRWGIGEKGKNNGILLIVALQDRKARVEVGYGLEPILPDALAGRVLDEQLFPAFKQQRYFEGLNGAVNRICEIVERGEPATAAARRGAGMTGFGEMILLAGFLSLFVAIGAFVVGLGIRTQKVPLILFGGFFGGIPFLMGFMMAAPLAPIVHLPLGIIMTIVGWRAGTNSPGRRGGWTSGFPSPGWTWFDSSAGSWGSSDWSSGGGGGFSSDWGGFGGGSSGGGGASGGW